MNLYPLPYLSLYLGGAIEDNICHVYKTPLKAKHLRLTQLSIRNSYVFQLVIL